MFAAPGPIGPPPDPILHRASARGGRSTTRERRRASILLAPDPGGAAAGGPGVRLAPVARAAHAATSARTAPSLVVAPERIRPWVAAALRRPARALRRARSSAAGPRRARRPLGHDERRRGRWTRAARRARGVATPAGGGPLDAADAPRSFNPRHTFEQFVIGDSNRLAHAAALAVAEMPGLAYNPLFICGPPGLGKTHLLHSIAQLRHAPTAAARPSATRPPRRSRTTSSARSTASDIDAFKAAYRGVDVLLVDDVQFLQAKARTEEEFFHTFNALHEAGAQIVADLRPRCRATSATLEARLRERFEAGLVTRRPRRPTSATRLTILRKRVQQDRDRRHRPGALELIADRVTDNVRALEGALIRVVAFGSLTGRAVTAELADEVLAGLYPELRRRRRRATVEEIQAADRARRSASRSRPSSPPSRAGDVAWPRQVAMYLARELTDADAARRSAAPSAAATTRPSCTPAGATAERIAGDRRRVRRRAPAHRAPAARRERRDAARADRLSPSCAQALRTRISPHRAAYRHGCAHHRQPL